MKTITIAVLFAISGTSALWAGNTITGFEINGISAREIQNIGIKTPPPGMPSDEAKDPKLFSVTSADGTKISINYKAEVIQQDWAGRDVAAKPVMISVYNPVLNAKDGVKIALKAWCKTYDGKIVSKTHKLALLYAGAGKFAGSITEGVMLYSDYAGQYRHNLVVTVNGRRLRNPGDNSDSFNIDFGFDPGQNAAFTGRIPLNPKDAFKGLQECSIVDAMFIRQPDLKESVVMLAPCMTAVSKRYAVSVSAKEAPLPGSFDSGIGVFVSGKLLIGNSVLMDLNYSIKMRHGGFFGHRAYLQYLK